jgi:hypothetical protein
MAKTWEFDEDTWLIFDTADDIAALFMFFLFFQKPITFFLTLILNQPTPWS